MMPSAKIVRRLNVPPLNISKNPNTVPWFCVTKSSKRWESTPGMGIQAPTRYTASKASVNSSRFRRSGIRKTLAIASKNFMAYFSTLLGFFTFNWPVIGPDADRNHFRLAARRLNLFQGRLRKNVGLHVDLALELACPQNLQAMLDLTDDSQFQQLCGIEGIAFQALQSRHVDDGVFLAENVGESALGKTAMQRHLAALKPAHARVAGNRFGTLGSAAGVFSTARSHALADALILMFLSARRP